MKNLADDGDIEVNPGPGEHVNWRHAQRQVPGPPGAREPDAEVGEKKDKLEYERPSKQRKA